MTTEDSIVLMDAARIERSLNRMAHEIAEKNMDNRPVVLFGINERGYAIAQALAELLTPIFDRKAQSVQFKLDASPNSQFIQQWQQESPESYFCIVVDDVIFTGQTMFTALKKLSDQVNPSEMHTAVLIDRGHRKFPIQAEFYGMELPTKANEHVSVEVEAEHIQQVVLTNSKR